MGQKTAASACVAEEVRIAVKLSIDGFLERDEQELEFSSSLSSNERAYIHRLCSQIGLVSKSKGKGINRHVTVRRKLKGDVPDTAMLFGFGQNSTRVLHSLLHRWPVKLKEKYELQPRSAKQQHGMQQESIGFRPDASKTSGRLNNGVPQIPVKRGRSDLDSFRKTLPVAAMVEDLVDAIDKNPVVLICGETGSGKTTQIPQYILDNCHARGEPCRVICTQPRRISAVAMAERVAAERGECVGHTVGYQIRLESRVSPRTLLTFCTNGVLLRTLMAGDSSLSTVTHVIVDEVHERDRFGDFLLTKLRQLTRSQRSSRTSPRHARFRLIMMSAALDVDLFINYFSGCPVVNIPGKMFSVQEYFLEDVLAMTGYSISKDAKDEACESTQGDAFGKSLLSPAAIEASLDEGIMADASTEPGISEAGAANAEFAAEATLKSDAMDEALYTLWHHASQKCQGIDDGAMPPSPFLELFHLIQSGVPVNYRHSETGVTALMASAMHGAIEECEDLISLGADATLKVTNGWTAADMAYHLGHEDLAELLGSVIDEQIQSQQLEEAMDNRDSSPCNGLDQKVEPMTEDEKQLVLSYQKGFDDERVDTDLIMKLLALVCEKNEQGAILVFLPGYDDIVTLRERITSEPYISALGNIKLFVLHSSMQPSSDQKLVFRMPPAGTRKIILSTNIAETSITIDDVVFVIDGGKEKIKIYEALTCASALKSVWVSKSSALQRKGRAGRCRPGICFRLFSKARYDAMPMFQTAEILRTPLHELCLQAKLLTTPPRKRRSRSESQSECEESKQEIDSISDFLSRAPEPPSRIMLDSAVDLLKTIDALDDCEDLTELGHHLVDLPIEPRLGKMVLYSVVLKCLDPVLTIACALAYKDPFMMPAAPEEKRQARNCRVRFAAGAFSDHMCLLRAFQAWQKAKSDGWERDFCEKNYLSSATMQMIIGMRTQLLGQLRAAGFVRARGGSDIRDLNTNSENWAVVKAAICASAYPSILRFDREDMQLRSREHKKVRFHNSSVLSYTSAGKKTSHGDALLALPTNWLVYDELTMSTGHFSSLAAARCCTAISPACISLFSGPAHLSQAGAIIEPDAENQTDAYSLDSDSEVEDKRVSRYSTLLVTDWIRLKMDPQLCEMVLDLRVKWYSLFLRRIRAPAKPWLPEDDAVLGTIINILSSEDRAHNLLQPSGIGQRPRPMSQEDSKMQRGFSGIRMKVPGKNSSTDIALNLSRTKITGTPNTLSGKLTPGLLSVGDVGTGNSARSSPCFSPQPTFESCSPSPRPALPQISYVGVICKLQKNIQISQKNGIWVTNAEEEKVLSAAFEKSGKAILFIFLQDVYFAQGYARVSSPAGFFSNDAEVQNIGWERDGSDAPLTSYFSIEWIKKFCRLIETPPKGGTSGVSVWELDDCEGEKLLSHWAYEAGACVPDPLLRNTPTAFPGSYPYSYPGMQTSNMFNPYQSLQPPSIPVSSPLQPYYQRAPAPPNAFNPYQYAQQQFAQHLFPQNGMLPTPGLGQSPHTTK